MAPAPRPTNTPIRQEIKRISSQPNRGSRCGRKRSKTFLLRAERRAERETEDAALRITGVRVAGDVVYRARAVILCAGTFLQGLMHVGETTSPGGRMGEPTSCRHSAVRSSGWASSWPDSKPARRRASTGGPSISTRPNCSSATASPSRSRSSPSGSTADQLPCWITYTTPAVHELIRANLHRAPMFSGQIQSTGPRYCPSIETKIVRFADKPRHQLFLEPEGRHTRRSVHQRPIDQPAARRAGGDAAT